MSMVTESELRKAVEAILMEMGGAKKDAGNNSASQFGSSASKNASSQVSDAILDDITAMDLKEIINVPNPKNLEALKAMKQTTPARIGAWRAGPRYLTSTMLRFRADHAAAMDAVFTDISEDWLKENNLTRFTTKCTSKDEYLTRPDLGRQFDEDQLNGIKKHVGSNNRVVIYVADGLSTTAVITNAINTYKAICDGLVRHGVKPSDIFFVQYGRVGAEDVISECTGCEVVCTLIGERPGLISSESMSAYLAYKATVDMPEARRTVVSNIHKGGTPAVEAGGYIADLIKAMLDKKASGLDLKL